MRNCKTFTLLTLLSLSTGCAEDVSGRDAKPTSDHETTLRALEKSASHTILAGDGVLEAGFHADAIHLFREENHLLTMRWAGVNKPPSTFAKARPVLEGEEIRYKRGAITEWYKPHANGIEQGLALEAAPEFEGQDAIRLTWCIAGAQDAELLEDGRALSLGTSNGQKLRVDKLAAWDSTGMRLRARFDLEAHNACEGDVSYNLIIHTDGATFPVTIDPVFQTEDQSFLVDGLGGTFASDPAAMEGDLLVISAPNKPSVNRAGVLYVHERHDGGVNNWGLVQTISAVGLETRFEFGRRLKLSGDWLVATAIDSNLEKTGKILLYKRANGQFQQHKIISPPALIDESSYGRYGISLNGDTLAVGSRGSNEVYIYEKDMGGFENWGESARIKRDDIVGFGYGLFLKGNLLLANNFNIEPETVLHERNAQGQWVATKSFFPLTNHINSGALYIEGDRIHIGIRFYGASSDNLGKVQLFGKDLGGPNNWGAFANTHQPAALVEDAYFGHTITGDENFMFMRARRVGIAPGPATAPAEGELGGAILFTPDSTSPTGWSEERTFTLAMPYSSTSTFDGIALANRAMVMTSFKEIADPSMSRAYIWHLNELPIPDDLQVQTEEETSVEVTLTGSDPEGDTLEYRLAEDPQHGTVQLAGDKVTYVPEEDFVGTDAFTYEIFDGYGLSEEGIVTVEVTPVDDPPLAYEQSVSTDEDVAVEMRLPSLDKDSDPAVLSFAIATQPAHGTVTITANNATYTPEPDFNGEDTFTFAVSDESSTSAPAKVTITVRSVNDPPVLMGLPTTLEVPDGEAFSFELEANDKDGDTLEFSVEGLPVQASLEGNRLSWTPSYKKAGEYVFNVEVSDGELSDSGELTVVVVARDENGNGIADGLEEMQGFDPANPDDDGDGILDEDEIGDWNDPVDTDGDGTPDVLDTDSDGDGILDADEGSSDGDGDGIPAFQDKDRDGDGIDDDKDSCVDVSNPEPKDLDEDGIDDACDDDVDYVEDFDWQPGDEEPPGERGCSSTGSRQRAPIPMSLVLLVGVFGVLLRKRRLCLDTPQA